MNETDLFVTQNLYEGTNLVLVIDNIVALSGLARKQDDYDGPLLGVARMTLPDKPITGVESNPTDSIIRSTQELLENRKAVKPVETIEE